MKEELCGATPTYPVKRQQEAPLYRVRRSPAVQTQAVSELTPQPPGWTAWLAQGHCGRAVVGVEPVVSSQVERSETFPAEINTQLQIEYRFSHTHTHTLPSLSLTHTHTHRQTDRQTERERERECVSR